MTLNWASLLAVAVMLAMFSDARVVGYVERRALMSAPDAPTGWDLGCAVREELLN